MNIANGPAAAISLQSFSKKTGGKGKTEAYMGKVIAKSGKEIQVLINDKVYKIEPGNAQNIKIGDKIQVFFGKNLPPEFSQEMLKKFSGKLIDVFSLSLPYKTTQELEDLINQMPQKERLHFAKISNDIATMVRTILKEDFPLNIDNMGSDKDSVDIFDPKLPFNRRLIELSLKAKEMGKAWDQIPNVLKKEIIKEYVLFDLKQANKEQTQGTTESMKSQLSNFNKNNAKYGEIEQQTNNKIQDKSEFTNTIPNKVIIQESENILKEQTPRQADQNNTNLVQKERNPDIQQAPEKTIPLPDKGKQNIENPEQPSFSSRKPSELKENNEGYRLNRQTNTVQHAPEKTIYLPDKGKQNIENPEQPTVSSRKPSELKGSNEGYRLNRQTKTVQHAPEKTVVILNKSSNSEKTPFVKTLDEFKQNFNGQLLDDKILKRTFFSTPVNQERDKFLNMSPKMAQLEVKTLKNWLNMFLSMGSKTVEHKQISQSHQVITENSKIQPEKKNIKSSLTKNNSELPAFKIQTRVQNKTVQTYSSEEAGVHSKLKITNNQNRNIINVVIEGSKKNEIRQNESLSESLKNMGTNTQKNTPALNSLPEEKTDRSVYPAEKNWNQNRINHGKNDETNLKESPLKEVIREVQELLEKSLSKPVSIEKNLENLEKISQKSTREENELNSLVENLRKNDVIKDPHNIFSLLKKLTSTSDTFENPFMTNKDVHSLSSFDISRNFTFNKIKNSPLIEIEIKNLASHFKSLGIEQTEGLKVIYDIVNIAFRSVKEESVDSHLFPIALKNYLKLKLPQLIINNDIKQKNEENLISKIETFSKKAFIFIKGYADKLKANKSLETAQMAEKSLGTKNLTPKEMLPEKGKGALDKQLAVKNNPTAEKMMKEFELTEKSQKTPLTMDNKANSTVGPANKEEVFSSQAKPKGEPENSFQTEKQSQPSSKQTEQPQRNEFSSSKFLKFLNISSEKSDFSNAYSSLISLNKQPFAIDFQHQKMDKGGYEKNEMYRVFIETNTQLFGTVFVDTVVSEKNIDIYIYAEEQYAREFTNNSSTLIKRIKETDYNLRGLFIREKIDQNGILKLKVKQYTNPKKEGGFFRFA